MIRFNYYHGFAHKDIFTLDGKKFKEDLERFVDLTKALRFAQNDINTNWQDYIKRFKGEK